MSRVRDIVALVKPRITLMVVATGVVGLYLAPQTPPPETKLGLLIGMSLLVGGANALNMYLERDIDGRAERTKNRPLPAGRLEPSIALSLGVSLGVLAMLWLAVVVNLLTAGLGLLAFVAYTAVYTPMKQYSPSVTPQTTVAFAPMLAPFRTSVRRNSSRRGTWLRGFTTFVNTIDGPQKTSSSSSTPS